MPSRVGRRLATGLLGSLVVVACGNRDPGQTYKTCESRADCNTDFDRCELIHDSIIGLCTRACTDDEDCPDGDACVSDGTIGLSSVCVAACAADDDCPGAMSCTAFDTGARGCVPTVWVR